MLPLPVKSPEQQAALQNAARIMLLDDARQNTEAVCLSIWLFQQRELTAISANAGRYFMEDYAV